MALQLIGNGATLARQRLASRECGSDAVVGGARGRFGADWRCGVRHGYLRTQGDGENRVGAQRLCDEGSAGTWTCRIMSGCKHHA